MATLASEKEEFFDLTYSNEPASYYYLILEVESQQVKAAWFHSTKNLFTGFASYPFSGSFKSLIENHPFLASEFKEVLVCVSTANYLVSPKNILDGTAHDLFQLSNAFDRENQVLRTTGLVNIKSEVIHPIAMELESEIASSFKHVKILSHIAPRIEHEMNTMRTLQASSAVYAHVSAEFIDIRIYANGKLHLANAFYQTGEEDIAYYLLYSAEVMEINAEKTSLVLSGNVKIGDASWNLLSKYWKNLSLVKPLSRIEISEKLSGNNAAPYFHLTHALLCAS